MRLQLSACRGHPIDLHQCSLPVCVFVQHLLERRNDRYMFIGTLFFTLNIMVSQNAALRVDILDNFIHNQRSKHILNLITYVLTVVALLVFTLSGVMLVQAGLTSVSPSMHIPMWIIYAMMPLGYFLALIEVLRKIAAEIRAIRVLR